MYAPLHFRNYKNQAQLDTGAVQRALSVNDLRKIRNANLEALLKKLFSPAFKIQRANGSSVTVKKQVVLKFSTAGWVFVETFLILPTMGTRTTERSLSEKHAVTLDAKTT